MGTMPDAPDCLQDRYKILDDLIKDLRHHYVDSNDSPFFSSLPQSTDGAAIRLMCNMWYALKENPDYDVTQLVQDKIERNSSCTSVMFEPGIFQCYPASRKPDPTDSRQFEKIKARMHKRSCCRDQRLDGCSSRSGTSNAGSDSVPLNKVLCDLTEAVSFDRKCTSRLNVLLETEKKLSEQITRLEQREREGQELLKEADCIWSCMNDTYKKNIAESLSKQRDLRVKLTNTESNTVKWRKRFRDLQQEMGNLEKCHKDIQDKLQRKTNELKAATNEVAALKVKLDNIAKETESVSKTFIFKKTQGNKKVEAIAKKINELEKSIAESKKKRENIINEGKDIIKDVRRDLANIEKVLYEKQIEEHKLVAEKDGLADEIIFLRARNKDCDSNCKTQQKLITDELERVIQEINNFKIKCTQCSQSNDTSDIRKYCTDCTKCLQQLECVISEEICYQSQFNECICMKVKTKLMENVLENMYTVLMKYSDTEEGKKVAETVFRCLQKSRNGKLNVDTKKVVQDFVLDTIKRDLNVTIVGGAIKTRCELDPDSYQQLMLCLQKIKVTPIVKVDKAVDVKKEGCSAWNTSTECYCPKGPRKCICSTKAPKPEPKPVSASRSLRPMRTTAEKDNEEQLRPPSCKGATCTYNKNARAAQCSINSIELVRNAHSKHFEKNGNVYSVELDCLNDNEDGCICNYSFHENCPLHSDLAIQPRERIIDEVLGRFGDETPKSIEKILSYDCIDLGSL